MPLFIHFIYIISYLAKSSDAQRLAEDVVANLYLDDVDGDDDDIYIMMKCLSVCLSVMKNHHFLL